MSPTFINVTDMSAILIIHAERLSHLSPHALIEVEAISPQSSFTYRFQFVFSITLKLYNILKNSVNKAKHVFK